MPIPRPLNPFEAHRTLANRLGPQVDRLRQFSTTFGLRPYRVFLVWTRFTGEERGEGTEQILAKVEILPTPKVGELTSLQDQGFSAGTLATGQLRVDNVSAGFTRAQLTGLEVPGRGQLEDMPQDVDFFYEMHEDGRQGDRPVQMRFRLAAEPVRVPGNVSWSLLLEKQEEPLQPDGRAPFDDR